MFKIKIYTKKIARHAINAGVTFICTNLQVLYGLQGPSGQANQPAGTNEQPLWDALANSPLIQGEGDDKIIKLQFDVSAFDPNDIRLEFINDKLQVYAKHEEKTNNLDYIRELRRQVVLPHGIERSSIIATLSRDGVLTVQAPLPPLVAGPPSRVLSKNLEARNVEVKKLANTKVPTVTEQKDPDIPSALVGQVTPTSQVLTSPAPASVAKSNAPPRGVSPGAKANRTPKTSAKSKPAKK
ncbi:hsp20/alpha crystallin family domain-containing protein [Phthorimaea operculella]|nr:hsp20/alpha crystallin family domain-containing protein [Phthorimaea operculella]